MSESLIKLELGAGDDEPPLVQKKTVGVLDQCPPTPPTPSEQMGIVGWGANIPRLRHALGHD